MVDHFGDLQFFLGKEGVEAERQEEVEEVGAQEEGDWVGRLLKK